LNSKPIRCSDPKTSKARELKLNNKGIGRFERKTRFANEHLKLEEKKSCF